ncbi:hypothetical protein ABC345_02110 [Shouchella sp. 1P09AA]|uniref:hypothetical protein n=1 Tax=unclassified Shouchella TaxID=2893065 RepID=UPI0039A2459B
MLIDVGRFDDRKENPINRLQGNFESFDLYFVQPVKRKGGWLLHLESEMEEAKHVSLYEGISHYYIGAFPHDETEAERKSRKEELLSIISMREAIASTGGVVNLMCSTLPQWKKIGMNA